MERGRASRPTSFYSQTSSTSCCSLSDTKLEMRNLMDSFIADARRIRNTLDDSASDAPAASPAHSDGDVEMAQPVPGAYSVDPVPSTPAQGEYEHKGIWCDSCNQKVFGIRHKCLDCYNFDLVSHFGRSHSLHSSIRNPVQPVHDHQGYPIDTCRYATHL